MAKKRLGEKAVLVAFSLVAGVMIAAVAEMAYQCYLMYELWKTVP